MCIMHAVIIGWCMGCGGGVNGGWGWCLVDRTCWREILRWPLAVLVDLGRCLHTRLDANIVQVVNKPASMALRQLSMTGLKQAK